MDLQKFLGFSNFYRRFIRDFSKVARLLNDLLQKGIPWHWGQEQQAAFTILKLAFTQALTLAYFDFNKKSVLETDASDWAAGGILSQYDDDGLLRPVAYFSLLDLLCSERGYCYNNSHVGKLGWPGLVFTVFITINLEGCLSQIAGVRPAIYPSYRIAMPPCIASVLPP